MRPFAVLIPSPIGLQRLGRLHLRPGKLALRLGLVLLALTLPAAACRHETPPRPSVLLITVDTLRADMLGCYGKPDAHTPACDHLAREGTRYETALTPLPRTTPSIASILTGLDPPAHKVRGLMSTLPVDVPTLAEWLRARGRRTGAFTSNLFLRTSVGFGKGFEAYSNPKGRWSGNSATAVTDEALEWVSALAPKEAFFLWVHYLDPHWTYAPSPPFDSMFDPGYHGPWPYGQLAAGDAGQGALIFHNTMSPAEVAHAIALYQGEIAATDRQVGRLLEALAAAGRLQTTLVVLTSDHGESLGEHAYYFDHGEYLYDGTLKVPLIFSWPGHVPAGRVVARMARLTDIAPTALALMGDPLPSGLDGRSLADDLAPAASPAVASGGSFSASASLARGAGEHPSAGTSAGPAVGAASAADGATADGAQTDERTCWIESDHNFVRPENPRHFVNGIAGKWRGIRGERYKLIFIPHDAEGTAGEVELYDIQSDPAEAHDLSRERPEIAQRLLARLRRYWLKNGAAASNDGPPPDAEILRSLGYL